MDFLSLRGFLCNDMEDKRMNNGIVIKKADSGMLISGTRFVTDSVAESALLKYFSPDYPADKMMSELLEDTSFEMKEIIGHLKYCAVQIIGNGRRTTMEEHKKFMGCIKDFLRAIDLCEFTAQESGTLLSKILFSCFITQPKLFKETMDYLIKKRCALAEEKFISGAKIIVLSTFGTLLNKVSEEERANELYNFMKEYFEKVRSLYEKSRKENVYIKNYERLLSNCMDCASAAFKETGNNFYEKEYAMMKKHLREEHKNEKRN